MPLLLLPYVTRRHVAAKVSKGHGEGVVAPDAHICWPIQMARLTHPLHVESAIYISMALQWRGGQLAELWKMKGSQAFIKYVRDITLYEEDAKMYSGRAAGVATVQI